MKITSLLGTAALGASIALGGAAACAVGDDTVEVAEYEDCDVEDQNKKEDDCGYWQHPGGSDIAVADYQVASDWAWIWFAWVIIGQPSRAPLGWMPPRGIKPPVKIVRMPKSKVCAMSITAVLVAPAPPKPPSVPKAPAPAPKINNNPPKVNQPAKPYTPPKPGVRPAGC